MNPEALIYVAGHKGMVGSAIVRQLRQRNYSNLLLRTSAQLDLTNQQAVRDFFEQYNPDYVFLAAAFVGGIHANNTLRGDFIYRNIMIQNNVINAAYQAAVQRLMFLGSSCIYPKNAPQPINEDCLLTSPLEPTNRPYAVAKISGVEMCWSYNRQYNTKYSVVMPCNLYGIGDNYHPENSHVIPALIRRAHENRNRNATNMTVWGTGTPRREFLFADDLAQGCVDLMAMSDVQYDELFISSQRPPMINIGQGADCTIAELVAQVCEAVGFTGDIEFDPTRPDGTMRKLMDSARMHATGWRAKTGLAEGLKLAYQDFLAREGEKDRAV